MAKRALSESLETTIEIDAFIDGEDFIETISRALFEDINNDLFNKTIDILDKTIEDSGLKKEDINDIVMVGGSIRIPKIQSLIGKYFGGKIPFQDINPDEAVAYGAAIQAIMLCGEVPHRFSGILIRDVTPLSLGVANHGFEMSTIIKRNSPIPCSVSSNRTTVCHYQEFMTIGVYEGERLLVKDNKLLGEFILTNIQRALANVPSVDVTFSIDSNGILHVTAKDKVTFSQEYCKIEAKNGRLNQQEIDYMINSAKKLHKEDQDHLELMRAKNRLKTLCYNNLCLIKNGPTNLDSQITREAKVEYQRILDWLDNNKKIKKKTYLRRLKK